MTPTKSDRWLLIRVELVSGCGSEFDSPPGRDFLVHPTDTFARLASAINTAFTRWDTSHLHEFRLSDGRCIGLADAESPDVEDEDSIQIGSVLNKDNEFTYVFDFGDDWIHRCRVLSVDVHPEEELGGAPPDSPIAIFGWGSIPDQYGREAPDD